MGRIIWLLFLAVVASAGCSRDTPQAARDKRADKAAGDIVIGAVWPWNSSKGTLWHGVEMALDEINGAGGLLGGRQVRILKKDDQSSLEQGRLVAQELAENPDVVAVIGHLNTYISIPAAYIYERAGIVMLSPGSSGQQFTENGLRYAFRSLPGNKDGGRQMAEFAAARGYKRVLIYYIKNDYGLDLANYFEQGATRLGLTIVDRRSYDRAGDNYGEVLDQWSGLYKFDAIFLAGSLPESAEIIAQARARGIKAPIFGGAGLDSPLLIEKGGASVEGTVVFSLFSPDDPRPDAMAFTGKFRRRYGHAPDSTAAQGYDAVMLLAEAIRSADSSAPRKIAAALHGTREWKGVTGAYSFSETGDLVDKRLVKVVVRDGRFVLSGE